MQQASTVLTADSSACSCSAQPSLRPFQPPHSMHVSQEAQRGAALRESAAAAEAAAVAAKHEAAQYAVLALRRRLGRRAVTLAALGQTLAGAAADAGLGAHAVSPAVDPLMVGMPGGLQRPASYAADVLAGKGSSQAGAPGCPAASQGPGCEGVPQGAGPATPILAPDQLPSVLQALLARHAAAMAQLLGKAAAADARITDLAKEMQELRVSEAQARASAASADALRAGLAREVEELRATGTQTRTSVAAAEARSARLTGELGELRAAEALARASAAAAEEAASARERAAADHAAAAAACIAELQARLSMVSASVIVARQVGVIFRSYL